MPQTGFFIDGANAKLIVNNVTLAYATDVSYRIIVKHATPRVLGMYEAQEFPALSYEVNGSFTVIRYAREHQQLYGPNAPADVSNKGNSIGQWKQDLGTSALQTAADTLGSPFGPAASEGRAHASFVPGALNKGMHFDIEIRQKMPSPSGGPGTPAGGTAPAPGSVIGQIIGSIFPLPQGGDECAVARFRHCRITESEFTLTKRGVARQRFSFMARYADEDGFSADKSGVGQDLE